MTLRIDRSHYEQLRRHAEANYPHEACGALIGHRDALGRRCVQSVVRCSNACVESPQNRYRIDPAELLRIQREAREAGQAILGFYHSHPEREALWSPTDLDEAHWSGCSYVITGVNAGRAEATHSYVLTEAGGEKNFEEENIEFTEGHLSVGVT